MNSTSVLLRVRNEGPYLIEWIAHHLALGFDDIAIVHNENDDGSTGLLQIFENHGICRHFESPDYSEGGAVLTPGQRAVRTIKENRAFSESKWLYTADADELLILKQHKNIAEFLGDHEGSDQVILSWDLFVPDLESSRFEQNFDMRKRFRTVTDDYSFIKSLSRIDKYPENIAPHRIIGKSRRTTLPNGKSIDPASLKLANGKNQFDEEIENQLAEGKTGASLYHYRFKSATEFCMRQLRGVAGPYSLKNNGMLFVNTLRSDPASLRKIDPKSGSPGINRVDEQAKKLLALPGVEETQERVNSGYLRQCREIEDRSLTYQFILGYLDDPDEFSAIETALQLLKDNPKSSEMLWLAAFCHRHEKHYEQAYRLSMQAIEQTPKHTQHHNRFVENMRKLALRDKPRASLVSRIFSKK